MLGFSNPNSEGSSIGSQQHRIKSPKRSRSASAGSSNWLSRRPVVSGSSSVSGGEGASRRRSESTGMSTTAHHSFFTEVFQVGMKNFLRQYTCDGGAAMEAALGVDTESRNPSSSGNTFSSMLSFSRPAVAPAVSLEEAGIEFDEEEILRRDYELSRV